MSDIENIVLNMTEDETALLIDVLEVAIEQRKANITAMHSTPTERGMALNELLQLAGIQNALKGGENA